MPTARTSNAVIGRMLDAMSAEENQEPLTAAIERYLIKRSHSHRRLRKHRISMIDRPRPAGRISPSGIGGCKRQAVFKFTGVPLKIKLDSRLELIFEDGNWRHHKWQALFHDMQRVLGRRHFRVVSIEARSVYPDLFIAGHLDAHLVIEGEHYIIDIKGINSFGYKRVVLETQAPMEHHTEQLIAYMKAKKVKRGIILYDNKDNQQYKCFRFNYSEEVWAKVVEWCDSVITSLENERLPPKHPDCNAGVFKYEHCGWRYLCYGRKTNDFLRELAYNHFTSVEAAWEAGFAEFERALEAAR